MMYLILCIIKDDTLKIIYERVEKVKRFWCHYFSLKKGKKLLKKMKITPNIVF